MTDVPKRSTLIFTAPRSLTKEQREQIVGDMHRNLPMDVGVILLDPGFTCQPITSAPDVSDLTTTSDDKVRIYDFDGMRIVHERR